jgi:Xaa-Pro dipeptidase
MLLNKPRVAAFMRDQRLDALLASTLQNVFYLSGFWNQDVVATPRITESYAIVAREQLDVPSIATGIGAATSVLTACPHSRATFFGSFFRYTAPDAQLEPIEQHLIERLTGAEIKPNSLEALVGAFDELEVTHGVVGYEERGISEKLLSGLRVRLPHMEFRAADETFLLIRAVKTEEELRRLHAAVALTEAAVRAAMAIAHPGVTEEEMAREFDRTIAGGGGCPLFTMIYFGRRGAMGPQPFMKGVLRRGDIIRFDVGCVLGGYCSDIARNFAIGDPGSRLRQLHTVTLAAEDAALEALRPGVKASAVFHAGVDGARAAGLPKYGRHHIGHAVGLEVYEKPLLGPHDDTIIEEGMVFEVETPYYELGSAGLQPEDTVVVTRGAPRMLTTLPRELVVVE